MKSRYFVSILLLALAACSTSTPSAPTNPVTPPSSAALTATIALATPSVVSTPTIAGTPTRTNTPVPTATFTLPPLPTPSGVTFKFDDGVPPDQRDTIIQGLAMARAYLGESRPMTVIAYADLNAEMDEISRHFNEPRTSARLRGIQQTLQADRASAYPDVMFFPMSKTWQSRERAERLRTISHEYFHAVEGFLTNTDPFNYTVPHWLYEGTADFASIRVLAHYGYYDLAAVRRDRIERIRGVTSPISTMTTQRLAEREDLSAGYFYGYLADEMLAEIAGEPAVLRKFWENFPKYPGWQLVFKATFGMTEDEFYARFENKRRAEFPPYCGTQGVYATPAPSEPLAIKLVRQDPPGPLTTFATISWTMTQQPWYSYTFCVTGYPLVSLTDSSAYKIPTSWGRISCGGNCVMLLLRGSVAPGSYTFAIELPDKRRAEVQFQHTVPPTVTPRP